MSIYDVLSFNIPVIAYSVIHQPKKSVTTKEYGKTLHDLRTALNNDSLRIQSLWDAHLADLTSKTVQTSRGNLSQFLSTPLQSDAGEIQKIIRDQINQTSEQLLPNIHYGVLGGYDGRYLLDLPQGEIPNARISKGRLSLQTLGFKVSKSITAPFESLYHMQGGSNLDILEHIIRSSIGVYDSAHGNEITKSGIIVSSLFNLLYLDGVLAQEIDRFELQVRFDKGKTQYEVFHKDIQESFKVFRTEIHDVNVSVWQRKLGLGAGEEYTIRIRTKDRSTLRTLVNVFQKFVREDNLFASALGAGTWFIKEII